ncbi:FxSxx-COOH system tetratricopeptide repeat protein [Dactylosporangium sp. CS-033363]|uniref:FxSxx-COOH system tetratricopeptide repeat protein n=1 Tax=Dactylosporangium sp. CS-033363 TaxID=3239935 RepID=UPI003D913697
MTQHEGQVITFYSYKGGTGRTMALANVAWILAANGHRVLVADWDLESPGLHRFFGPFLDPLQVAQTEGVVNLLGEYTWAVLDETADRPADWFRDYASVERYAFSLDWEFPGQGSLDIMLAGRHNLDYAAHVAGLAWETFFNLGGAQFLDALRQDMKARYDYVLIDSRTGLSDVADICTLHLPDVLVDCFTLSYQGIDGAAEVARRVGDHERPPVRSRRILPVPMRVDDGEKTKVDAGRAFARRRFADLPKGMSEDERRAYWLTVEVPYRKFYGYEETLATFGDEPGARNTLLSSYETLTAYITSGDVTALPKMDELLRAQTMAKFNRKQAVADDVIVLRYSPADQVWAEWVRGVLVAAGVRVADPAEAPGPQLPSRPLVLVSRNNEQPELDTGALVLYLDDTPPLPDLLAENWVSIAGSVRPDAVRRLLQLIGLDPADAAQTRAAMPPRFPGEPLLAYNAPGQNTRFTGRTDVLRRLRATLRGRGGRGPVALYGRGGIGKTQLATEYAHRFRGAYDVVWWMAAYPPQFVDVEFSDLARELGLPHQPQVPERVRQVRQWLQRAEPRPDGGPLRWLLVFDNVEDYHSIAEYLPPGDGDVLITTRKANLDDAVVAFEIGAFEPGESVEHLVGRVGAKRISPAEAAQIAGTVEHMPMFVALAGALLADSDTEVADYIAGLVSVDPASGLSADVWSLSLDRLRKESPGAFRLLQLAAVLAPEISLDIAYDDALARIIARHDDRVRAQLAVRGSERSAAIRLVQRLNRLALIKLDQQGRQVVVHQLLQATLRARMSDDELAKVRVEAHELLAGARPPGEVDDPELQQRLLVLWPHLDTTNAIESENPDVRQLVIDRVRYIALLGGYDQGLKYALEADGAWEAQMAALPPEDPRRDDLRVQLLHLRFNRANLLRSLGQFRESRRLSEETLREQEQLIGESHPQTLWTANGYGGDLRALGLYEEALNRDLKSYEASVRESGPEEWQSLIIAGNVATSYRLMGNFRQALEVDERTLEIWKRRYGMSNRRTLLSANNLARDLREAGRYAESVTDLRVVLAAYWDLLGDDSREALTAQVNLSASLRGNGELTEAIELVEEAWHGLRDRFGADHPDTALARLSRASTLLMRPPAERPGISPELLEIEATLIRLFGPDHPYIFEGRVNRAVALWDEGEPTAARDLGVQTAAALRDLLGADHPFVLAARNNAAVFLIGTGDAAEGTARLEHVVQRLEATLGADHPDSLRSRGNLALAREEDGPGASVERNRIADQLAERVGRNHPSVLALRERRYVRRILDPHVY